MEVEQRVLRNVRQEHGNSDDVSKVVGPRRQVDATFSFLCYEDTLDRSRDCK